MTTPTPEATEAEAVAAARAALEQRLSWASLDWPNLYPNMIDAIIGTVVPAAAPIIAAQAKAEALREAADAVEVIDPAWDSALYVDGAYHPLPDWLRARAATVEGKSE